MLDRESQEEIVCSTQRPKIYCAQFWRLLNETDTTRRMVYSHVPSYMCVISNLNPWVARIV